MYTNLFMYTNEICTSMNCVHNDLCAQMTYVHNSELCNKRGGNTTSNTVDYGILLWNNLTSLIDSDLDKKQLFFQKNTYFFKKHT